MNRRSSRKLLVWITALCLIFSSVGFVSAASANDVKGHWAEATINSWTSQGLVSGYEDGTVRPDSNVNREEFTALVNRSFAFAELGAIQFTDVAQTDWSYADISKAKAAGYIAGYEDGTFRPMQEISRQEAAVIVTQLLGLEASSSASLYVDAKNNAAWSMSAIGSVTDLGIMIGYPDGTFLPEQSVTRAEAVVLLDRAMKAKATLAEGVLIIPTPTPTPTPIPVPPTPSTPGMGVDLGTAQNYAILAKTGVSTVPTSSVTGDIGISPAAATAITGFDLILGSESPFSTSIQVVGNVYAPDYAAPTASNLTTAVSNMETAYTDAAGRAPDYTELHSGNISGQTLAPGVYNWGTSVQIDSGTYVTLNGNATDVWIFQIAGGLTQASATQIILTGGAKAENIFWQVADTVAIGTTAHFEGIILAQTNISVGTGATINGRLLAQTAVTLDQNTIVAPLILSR